MAKVDWHAQAKADLASRRARFWRRFVGGIAVYVLMAQLTYGFSYNNNWGGCANYTGGQYIRCNTNSVIFGIGWPLVVPGYLLVRTLHETGKVAIWVTRWP